MRPSARVALGALAVIVLLATPFVLLARTGADVSDTEIMGPNRLATAELDVAVGARTVGFAVGDMAPGDRAYGYVELRNDGDLPMAIELVSRGDGSVLGEQLTLALWPSPVPCAVTPDAGVVRRQGLGSQLGETVVGDPAPGVQDRHALVPGEVGGWCIEVELPLGADNAVQGLTASHEVTVEAVHLVDSATMEPLVPSDE